MSEVDAPKAAPGPSSSEIEAVVASVSKEALSYIESLAERPLRSSEPERALEAFAGPLPEEGAGAADTLERLFSDGVDAAVHSAGPRFFHFVIGGVTPAALGAEWFGSVLDQNPGLWIASPLGARLELVSVAWLLDLFRLPSDWGGVLTTGATMANFVSLACARHWCGERAGLDVEQQGVRALPEIRVLSSGYIHASSLKACGMLGLGRDSVRKLTRDSAGRIDLDALEHELDELDGAPSIVIANAGEVNAGDFDPIDDMAALAQRYGAWLHVDGAFGLFARATPETLDLCRGIEAANSVAADGHKWLNVPYDSGFAFVSDRRLLQATFGISAAYLTPGGEDRPDLGFMGPEMSRKARGLAVWATLNAYGREGHRRMIERHLMLARRVGERVEAAPDLELLAEVKLNIVCFRLHPPGLSEQELDELNAQVGRAVLDDGRVFVGTTIYRGKVAFRPAIVNWRTTEADVDLMVDVLRELSNKAVSAL